MAPCRAPSSLPTVCCPVTGPTLRRGARPFPIRYKGEELVVGLPGYYPDADGDGVRIGADMQALDAALRRLKARVGGVP